MQVILLFEGADEPARETAPTEALMLHGCKAEEMQESDDGFELSITDSEGGRGVVLNWSIGTLGYMPRRLTLDPDLGSQERYSA